jgi:hypothetical protein
MNIKKSLMAAGAAATIGLTGSALTAGIVSAATTDSSGTDGMSSLVDKIATKFNLNKEEVKAVFDEDRASHQVEHAAKMEERLTQAVKDGKLTEDQKSKILAKLQELKDNRPDPSEMKGKTRAERREAMEKHHAELETWAKENDIPMEYLRFRMGGPGHGPGFGHGEMGTSTSEN